MPNPPHDWSLNRVNAPQALNLLRGPADWGDIRVAHIDTGVTPHQRLGNRVDVASGVNYVDVHGSQYDPLNKYASRPGHGTRTCSILTGFENRPYTGVAPKLPVVPYRVTDTVLAGSHEVSSNIAFAIHHAVDETSCQVISISLGWPTGNNTDLGRAVDHAYEKGVIVVAAGGQEISTVCYPGKYWRAIAVGGYEERNVIYYDYGDQITKSKTDIKMNHFIDVWAPADPVWRANAVKPGAAPGTYSFGHGTSFATPHVSAAAAMWLLRHGANTLTQAYGNELWMRVEAFRMILKLSAQDLNANGYNGFSQFQPTRNIATVRPKQSPAPDIFEKITTGGQDILALLHTPLPAANALRKSSEAIHQSE